MQLELKAWGNSTGIRLPKELLRQAGVSSHDTLEAEVMDGRIILTPVFRHRSLQERAAAYGGDLRLSGELPREDPMGSEVW